jgi:N-acetylneuraminic acid mutarotase
MPTERTLLCATVLNEKLFIIGGALQKYNATSVVEVCDPAADTWSSIANLPSARCAYMACTFHNKIYVFGGCTSVTANATKNVYVYDSTTGTWSQKADMPFANSGAGIAVVDSLIYLIGGASNMTSVPYSTVLAYNPFTESWTYKQDIPTPRSMVSSCAVDGKIVTIGGTTENYGSVFYKNVEVFDPQTNTWAQKSDMPTGRWGLATCVLNGLVYAVGGRAGSKSCALNEVYNPATDIWLTEVPMQKDRNTLAVGAVGNKIYAAGGHTYPSINVLSDLEEYTPVLTGIDSKFGIFKQPDSIILLKNYPNPFNPVTSIQYELPSVEELTIWVSNSVGQSVGQLVDEKQEAGRYTIQWDASEQTSGIYVLRFKAGSYQKNIKMVVLK